MQDVTQHEYLNTLLTRLIMRLQMMVTVCPSGGLLCNMTCTIYIIVLFIIHTEEADWMECDLR